MQDIILDIVKLDKSETYTEENTPPEDGLYTYLYQPGEPYRNQERWPLTLSGVKIHIY